MGALLSKNDLRFSTKCENLQISHDSLQSFKGKIWRGKAWKKAGEGGRRGSIVGRKGKRGGKDKLAGSKVVYTLPEVVHDPTWHLWCSEQMHWWRLSPPTHSSIYSEKNEVSFLSLDKQPQTVVRDCDPQWYLMKAPFSYTLTYRYLQSKGH